MGETVICGCSSLLPIFSGLKAIVNDELRMRWAGHVAGMGEKRNAYRILVGKPEGKRPLGRHRCRWMDYIKMDLGGVWIGLIWLRIGTSGGLL
jgi:hypothetical protein